MSQPTALNQLAAQIEPQIYTPPPSPITTSTPVIRRLREADIPAQYRKVRLENTDWGRYPHLKEICEKYCEQGGLEGRRGLLLYGTPGTGKTHIAIAVLRRIVERTEGRKCVRFWKIAPGLEKIRASFDSDQRLDILDLTNYYLVVLDDYGKAKMTEWVSEQWYSLIDTLEANNRRAIITTNLSFGDLRDSLNEAVYSRLRGLCHPVRVEGQDHRLQKGA